MPFDFKRALISAAAIFGIWTVVLKIPDVAVVATSDLLLAPFRLKKKYTKDLDEEFTKLVRGSDFKPPPVKDMD